MNALNGYVKIHVSSQFRPGRPDNERCFELEISTKKSRAGSVWPSRDLDLRSGTRFIVEPWPITVDEISAGVGEKFSKENSFGLRFFLLVDICTLVRRAVVAIFNISSAFCV